MDFFEHQNRARAQTKRLIFLFILALALTSLIASIGAHFFLLFSSESRNPSWISQSYYGQHFWTFHLSIIGLNIFVIGIASLYRIISLSKRGGISIALELGARPLEPNTSNPYERRLLNVVEEMAIASGIAVPETFILEETGINAFAAGFQTQDAVIAVSRGAIETLSRDELQGVVAHEFSHIFHGDMRLNMNMMGVLFGLMFISEVGRFLISPRRRAPGEKNRGSPLALLGLGLFLAGSLGHFLGKLIQAAISRKREFLADASAVQYTRQTNGIAGALKKIGGWVSGSQVKDPRASTTSHFFIASPLSLSKKTFFSTHPPLEQRIKVLEPSFRGEFPKTQKIPSSEVIQDNLVSQLSGSQSSQIQIDQNIPALSPTAFLANLPAYIRNAVHEPYLAQAVCLACFVNANDQVIGKQKDYIQNSTLSDLWPCIKMAHEEILKKGQYLRLSLIDLSLPSLRRLSESQKDYFFRACRAFIHSDSRFEIYEYVLLRVLTKSLSPKIDSSKDSMSNTSAKEAIQNFFIKVIDATQTDKKQEILQKTLLSLGISAQSAQTNKKINLKGFHQSFEFLEKSPKKLRELVFHSAVKLFREDEKMSANESEMLRAISESFNIPPHQDFREAQINR